MCGWLLQLRCRGTNSCACCGYPPPPAPPPYGGGGVHGNGVVMAAVFSFPAMPSSRIATIGWTERRSVARLMADAASSITRSSDGAVTDTIDPRPYLEPRPEDGLDPDDWDALRALAHRMVDDVVDYHASIGERPVWQPVPAQARREIL